MLPIVCRNDRRWRLFSAALQDLHEHFTAAKRAYDAGGSPHRELREVAAHAIGLLRAAATSRVLSRCDDKEYSVFDVSGRLSRPYLSDLYESDPAQFRTDWDSLVDAAVPGEHRYESRTRQTNRVLYSAITAFCACYDVWKPGSRKTPGTFFEVLLGSILQRILPGYRRESHVILPEQDENVSTDIVFRSASGGPGGLVIPAKITTRERVVQPFAHQRILDSIFGVGTFKSVLVCVSEMQRDGEDGVNAICVPGTIRLFQMHLASMSGICYLDPPSRYLAADVASVVPVFTLGELLETRLPRFL